LLGGRRTLAIGGDDRDSRGRDAKFMLPRFPNDRTVYRGQALHLVATGHTRLGALVCNLRARSRHGLIAGDDADRLSPPDQVSGARLIGAWRAQVNGVDVIPDAPRRVLVKPVYGPTRGHAQLVAAKGHGLQWGRGRCRCRGSRLRLRLTRRTRGRGATGLTGRERGGPCRFRRHSPQHQRTDHDACHRATHLHPQIRVSVVGLIYAMPPLRALSRVNTRFEQPRPARSQLQCSQVVVMLLTVIFVVWQSSPFLPQTGHQPIIHSDSWQLPAT
jgi:hypothetical protein